ncbi:hypothetical protein [Mucilaginibacter gilvus]|uniref:GLPGLI family protein n=1 Tax=Mucilaginibacter gilvus TaxID=2305909 RepID=A0A3S3VN30_9SPHI|nr:hypothetical protein [Mucilaginibacter gilvus]RWY57042.1 hypothetical protein EPL05_00475 [Mucilaginibacter gilvus]
MKIKLLLLLAICACNETLFAQAKPAVNYVVTTAHDTIKCELKGTRKYLPLNSADKKFIKITPDKILEVFEAKDSTTYAAVRKPDQVDSVYLPRREHGKLDLYEDEQSYYGGGAFNGGMGFSGTTVNWYISKNGAPIIQLKSNSIFNNGSQSKRKNLFIEMIADDAPLLEEFKKQDSFSFKALQKYVHRYNQDMRGK